MSLLPKNTKLRKTSIIVVCLAIIAAAYFFFDSGKGNSFFMESIGPPPKNPQERITWISDNFDPSDHESYIVLDEKLPSWKELDTMHAALPVKKTYPTFIKAIQTYGPFSNLVEVMYFGDVLKDLGVNTQFVHAFHWFKKGNLKLWYQGYDSPNVLSEDESKRVIVHTILLAKQQGLAVILFPDYHELEDGGLEKLGISSDLEKRLETVALSLAEIAEKYDVEYLVPSNQIEMILESNGYSIQEAQRRTNAFYASVVPKIRQVYSGKIMYKMGGFGDWSNYDEISLEGADIFGFTGCYTRARNDIEFVTMDIKTSSAKANELSKKYGIPWMNAEFLISDDDIPSSRSEKIQEKIPIEDYYISALSAYNKFGYSSGMKGLTIHSLLAWGKVYGTSAMPHIKNFFASK